MSGKTIKIFFVDGKPNGLSVIELMQRWTGVALSCPRSEIAKLLKRPEARKPGVYILTGQDDESRQVAYIGEAENISKRLKKHKANSFDYWDRICFFTQKDDNLTKAHVQYLEARMIEVAKNSKRSTLINSDSPEAKYKPLPESDIHDMEYFLEQMQTLLPVLGINLLSPQPKATVDKTSDPIDKSPIFEIKTKDAHAQAMVINGEFTVLKDSLIRKNATSSIKSGAERIRNDLLNTGILFEISPTQYKLTENYAFNSPSMAAGVVVARSTNGRRKWKIEESGKTFNEWENDLLDQPESNA